MPIDSLDEKGLSLKELLQKYNEQGEILFLILSLPIQKLSKYINYYLNLNSIHFTVKLQELTILI